MQDQSTNNPANEATADPAGAFRALVQLAGEFTNSRRFFTDSLGIIARALGCPYASIEVNLTSELINESFHQGPVDPKFWAETVNDLMTVTLTEYEPELKLFGSRDADNPLKVAVMTALISDSNGSCKGVIGAVTECRNQRDAEARHEVLKTLAGLAADSATIATTKAASASGGASDNNVISRAAQYGSSDEMAMAITNNLRNRTGCEQVALGMIAGSKVNLVSISGFDEVKSRTPGAETILAAMGECLDAKTIITFPNKQNEATNDQFLLHKRWSVSVEGAAVASLPLISDGDVKMILSFRRENDEAFSREKLSQLGENMLPYATAMELVGRATEPAIPHVKRSIKNAVKKLLEPGRIMRKVIAAVLLLTVLWVCFGRLDYQVTAPASISPAHYRSFTAPFDAELTVAPLAKGDRVQAGQMICEFDTTTLRQQKLQQQAQMQMALVQANRFSSLQDTVEAELASVEAKRLQILIDQTQYQIDQAEIRAPFDGTVIAGDFRQKIGQRLPQGEALYTIASDEGWRVNVNIPQNYAADIQTGCSGRFVANARPGAVLQLKVKRINPTSMPDSGTNVFDCEASLDSDQKWLRSGMEGVAKVSLGKKPVWWIISHRAINFFRMKLWI